MTANQATMSVSRTCKLLGVSPRGFYAWLGRNPSDRARADGWLAERIRAIHATSKRKDGRPRIHAELRFKGRQGGVKRVGRLMRVHGLEGASSRKGLRTTVRGRARHDVPDLVDRNYNATQPDQLRVADITYVSTLSGFIFLAVVVDAFSRKVVGWSMASHMRSTLLRRPLEPGQCTSIAFGLRFRGAGVRPSTRVVGDAYGNDMRESCFVTLECELPERRRLRSKAGARMPSSNSSQAGTTRAAGTRGSRTARPWITNVVTPSRRRGERTHPATEADQLQGAG